MSGPKVTKIKTESREIHVFGYTFVITSSPIYNRRKRFGFGMTQIGWNVVIKVGELSETQTIFVDDRLCAESDAFSHFAAKWYSE